VSCAVVCMRACCVCTSPNPALVALVLSLSAGTSRSKRVGGRARGDARDCQAHTLCRRLQQWVRSMCACVCSAITPPSSVGTCSQFVRHTNWHPAPLVCVCVCVAFRVCCVCVCVCVGPWVLQAHPQALFASQSRRQRSQTGVVGRSGAPCCVCCIAGWCVCVCARARVCVRV
jgi:hypothetical protein